MELIAQGKQVLCLTITGKHSGTFNAASLAAQRFGRTVQVFDSLSLSLGLGLQALAAAQAAQAGRSTSSLSSTWWTVNCGCWGRLARSRVACGGR